MTESAAAWWPGAGNPCVKAEPHAEHYIARMVGKVMWTDGVCDGKGGWTEGESGRPRRRV